MTTLTGKIQTFGYQYSATADSFGPQPGRAFQLNTNSGKMLDVVLERENARTTLASEGLCQLTLESLLNVTEITATTYDDGSVIDNSIER